MEETKAKPGEDTIPVANGNKRHLGENVRRLREMLGISQKQLAFELDYSPSNMSKIESKADIDSDMLEKIAGALKVPVELIENFKPEEIVSRIQNFYDEAQQFNDESQNVGDYSNYPKAHHNTITNTFDVIQFALEANQKLSDRIITDKDAAFKELQATIAALESECKELSAKK